MPTFEIHKNGSFLSRHTAADEKAKAKIIETIRFSHGHGILSKNDGITVVEVQEKKADDRFVSVAKPEAGYTPPPKAKRPVVPTKYTERPTGTNLGSLLAAAGLGVAKKKRV